MLAEAGSGKTCAVDVQAADACHVVLASFVWGGQKIVTMELLWWS